MTDGQHLAISFGLEFEHTFAFHDVLLLDILYEFKLDGEILDIIKDPRRIPHKHFLSISPPSHQRYRWPSWILLTTDNDYGKNRTESKGTRANAFGHYLGKEGSDDDLKDAKDAKFYLRPYLLEALLIAQKILGSKGFSASVNADKPEGGQKPLQLEGYDISEITSFADTDYYKWTLMNDSTLIGATKRELIRHIPFSIDELEWDSWGVELVTPVFKFSRLREAAGTVHNYLSTIRHSAGEIAPTIDDPKKSPSDAKHAAFDSVWAGTHCHIGWDIKRLKEKDYVNLLKHLAFITMAQENMISSLHPRRRRGKGKPLGDVRLLSPRRKLPFLTNLDEEARLVTENEDRVADISRRYVAISETKSSRDKFKEWMDEQALDIYEVEIVPDIYEVTLKGLAQALWDEPDLNNKNQDKKQELERLRHALNFGNKSMRDYPRNNLIYYGNLIDTLREVVGSADPSKISKPTIEFRQHAGCVLDANEIVHWVKLLFALCHFAEQQAEKPVAPASEAGKPQSRWERELSKYNVDPEKLTFELEVAKFFGSASWLGLDKDEVVYWTKRLQHYVEEDAREAHTGLSLAPRTRKIGRVSKEKKLRASSRVEEGKARKAEQWRREQLRQFLASI